VAKCGAIVSWHWAHLAGADCDRWSEPTGPWHLSWQKAVDPRCVEQPRGAHRADLVGNGGVVIELQHSAISADEIRARENFYGDMIWLFDATHRFRAVESGAWTFFSLGRTKHLPRCRKPVFLDFGDCVVEVASFTDVFPEIHGLGIRRDREWFIERHLSDVITAEVERVRSDDVYPDPWADRSPHRPVGFPTKWSIDGEPRILSAATVMISLVDAPHRRRTVTDEIIESFGDIANGWTKSDLNDMQQLLRGTPVVLDGCLRVMPALPGDVRWRSSGVSPLAVYSLMSQADGHARAGRIPLLKESTKRAIVERTNCGAKAQGMQLWGGRTCRD
jgi:hypothetical protein